jgi:hypothetical protein
MVTLEEISSLLGHPFVLLVTGVGISSIPLALLGHWLENRRKKRELEVEHKRKELEIKVDIVSKIHEVYGSVAAKPFLSRMMREPISNIDEVLTKFYVDAFIVDSMLDSYCSSKPDILDRWSDFFSSYVAFLDATSLYFVKDRTVDQKSSLEHDLNKIKEYFSDNKEEINSTLKSKLDDLTADKDYDHELWGDIDNLYWDRVRKIYKDVLELDIKVF